MQRPLLAATSALFLALPAVFAACGNDAPTPDGPRAFTSDGAAPGAEGGDTDAAPALPAIPNTCRGVPVTAGHHYVTPGMCANVVAAGLGSIRQITFAPNGDLFGVDTAGAIKRLHDADGDGFYRGSEITTYAQTGNGNNCHIDLASGYIYAGSSEGVMRWPYGPTATSGGAGEAVVVGQPTGGHSKRGVHVYDGFLYVGSGSNGNVANPDDPDYDTNRSLIRRFDLSTFTPGTPFQWLSGEIVTQGLRNPNGFTKNAAGRMYAVVNGMDDVTYGGQNVHDDNPGEQVVEIALGKKYGYPFCFTAQRVITGGQVITPGMQLAREGGPHDEAWCATSSSPPATFIQAHSAPLDIVFFDVHPKGGLPERFRGGAFVALHGSWDRSPATGYKIIWIPFDAAGNVPPVTSTMTDTKFPYETVFGGGDANTPKDGPWSWTDDKDYAGQPRFTGVAISPIDGALYVSSDTDGFVYRIGLPNH
jgi:glucose/arabinose dehydrogenase